MTCNLCPYRRECPERLSYCKANADLTTPFDFRKDIIYGVPRKKGI